MIDWPGPSCQRHLAYFNTLFLSSTNQGDGSRSALRAHVKWFESGVCDNGVQPLNLEGFGGGGVSPLTVNVFFAVMNLIPSKCKFYKGDSLTLEISCLQFFSCYRVSSTSWRTVVFIVSEWVNDFTWTWMDVDCLGLLWARTQTETPTLAWKQLCPNSLRNEDENTRTSCFH